MRTRDLVEEKEEREELLHLLRSVSIGRSRVSRRTRTSFLTHTERHDTADGG